MEANTYKVVSTFFHYDNIIDGHYTNIVCVEGSEWTINTYNTCNLNYI